MVCIMYYIPSIHNNISVQWYYIHTQAMLCHTVYIISLYWYILLCIDGIHNNISVQWYYIYTQATLCHTVYIISLYWYIAVYRRNTIHYTNLLLHNGMISVKNLYGLFTLYTPKLIKRAVNFSLHKYVHDCVVKY